MKKLIGILIIVALFASCGTEMEQNQFLLNEEDFVEIETVSPEENLEFIKNNPNVVEPEKLTDEEKNKLFGWGKKPEEFKNKELPETYTNRTFIKNLSALTYKLEEIPGYIVKYDAVKKDYKIVSLTRLVKNNQYPETKIIDDGVLYSEKINSGASFNASFLIGGLSVDSKSIMELIIQDAVLSIVPDTLIMVDEIKNIANNLGDEERKNYYFVKGTTLTLVNNKKYKEQKFEAKVNSTYVTAEGKVYSSNENFSRERLISLDLISLDEIIAINDALASKYENKE